MSHPPIRIEEPIFVENLPTDGYVPVQARLLSYRNGAVRGVRREVAEAAYAEYVRQYGTDQSFDRLHERGGFGVTELLSLLTEALLRTEATTA